jgi:hypothetical protein
VAAALQCPDCGHQEMLDNLGGATTFRCGGCGRALKIPAQFRGETAPPGTAPGARPPSPADTTQAMPKVRGGSVPAPAAAMPPVTPPLTPPLTPPVTPPVRGAGLPTGGAPVAGAGAPPDGAVAARVAPSPESLKPPLSLRLCLWVIALPLGSLLVFTVASSLKLITKAQLEDTFLRTEWGRFVPIARLLPFCALVVALMVQLGVFGLERLRAHNLSQGRSGGRGPGQGARRGPTRPHTPGGQPPRGTNGARSPRDRVTS